MNKNISFMPVINHPGWANIKGSNELLQKSAALFALSLIPAVRRAAEAMSEFSRCIKNGYLNDHKRLPGGMSFGCLGENLCARIRQEKESSYLQQHAKLPGSRSTARLRKKRTALVDRWYSHYEESPKVN